MWSCNQLVIGSSETEILVAPGKRQYWKWLDFSLSDADAVLLVLKVSADGSLSIPALIEPLFHVMAFGIENLVLVLNDMGGLSPAHVQAYRAAVVSDLERMFGNTEAQSIPIIVASIQLPDSIASLRKYVVSLREPERDLVSGIQISINAIHTKGDSLILGGKLRSGTVRVGDELLLMPSAVPLKVESLCISGNRWVDSASAGRIVGIRVSGITKNHVSTGMVLVSGKITNGRSTRLVEAEVNLFNCKHPMRVGFSPVVNILSCQIQSKVTGIRDPKKGTALDTLELGQTGLVTISFSKSVWGSEFDVSGPSDFSRLSLRQENVVFGVGVIRSILD